MDEEIDRILQLIGRARVAWDQYNLQVALPADPSRFLQGHPWDAFNNGWRSAQARRDPALIARAWNRLQESLVDLCDAAERVRGRAPTGAFRAVPHAPDDRRVGPFSPPARPPAAGQEAAATEVGVITREARAGEPALVG